MRVPDKKNETLEAKARSGIFLSSLLYGNHRVITESDRTIQLSRHYIVKENNHPMKKCADIIRVGKDDAEEFTVDENDGFVQEDATGGSDLDLQPIPADLPTQPTQMEQERSREAPSQGQKNQSLRKMAQWACYFLRNKP